MVVSSTRLAEEDNSVKDVLCFGFWIIFVPTACLWAQPARLQPTLDQSPSPQVASSQPERTQYTILYTGRLLGYARVPDVQVLNQTPSNTPNDVAKAYISLLKAASKDAPRALRLGMGDNFAPNLFSRTFQMTTGPAYPEPLVEGQRCPTAGPAVRQPKDRFDYDPPQQKWVPSGTGIPGPIDYDNVAQFFVDAKYDAIVPGKEDFYYGTDTLRGLVGFLVNHNVHVLGANLAILTTRAPSLSNVHPRTPERLSSHRYGTDFGPLSIDLPDMVFPYKQQFVVKNARRVFNAKTGKLVAANELDSLDAMQVNYTPLITKALIC